tara:strand:+ start:1293 stop:2456 length:1164 start_codon:yes stop_codon:yes gene_type:complete
MKKKIAILGSTGSIGKSLINIIKNDKENFDVVLLTAEKNYELLLKQAKIFNVKNLIISDKKSFNILKKKNSNNKFRIFNNLDSLDKIFKKKIDYTMSSISGLQGLKPTLDMIRYSKKIAVANKEAIICGWNLIEVALKKNKTEFIPVDSEHFSIWSLLNKNENDTIDKVYITASGGPFLKWSKKKIKNVSPEKALKHPNWSMGKKISIDSASMMNKVFEVIETQRIFNLPKSKVHILIHEKSYVHAIVEFKNGLKKILAHDTNMTIPIFNTIYNSGKRKLKSKNLDIENLNNLNFQSIDKKKFPLIKILKNIPENNSLFETALITINDYFVYKFLNKKINFEKMIFMINKISNIKEFQKFKKIKPKNIKEIYNLRDYVSFKIKSLGI